MSPNPRIFEIIAAAPAVTALLGTNPVRFFPYGRAPKDVQKPYAVYAVYNAIPQNYLDKVPDIDNHGTQVDIYAADAPTCEQVFRAIRDAVEPEAHMTGFATPQRDSETDDYHARMEFDIWEAR